MNGWISMTLAAACMRMRSPAQIDRSASSGSPWWGRQQVDANVSRDPLKAKASSR
jgi:hypothetical protein